MKTIITHKKCVDGFLSALILKAVYPHAEVRRFGHDSEDLLNLEPAEGMIFCDITPKKNVEAFFAAGAVVLDHHKSAKHVFDAPNVTPGSRYSDAPGVSGAVLAHAHALNMGVGSPTWSYEVTSLVGIYDTWVEDHPSFGDACCAHAVLRLLDESGTKMNFRELLERWPTYRELGKLLHAHAEAQARELAEEAEIAPFTHDDGRVLRVAYLRDASHGAGVLNQAATLLVESRADLVVSGLGRSVDPARVALRARREAPVDCSEIATRASASGGGHRGAAGYSVQGGRVSATAALLQSLFEAGWRAEK